MKKSGLSGLAAVLAIGLMAVPVHAAGVTVGQFYAAIAQVKKLDSTTAEAAEASLRRAGFGLPGLGLDKTLTEGDMTAIASSLGLTVTTRHPGEAVSESQLSTFMSSFRGTIATRPGAGSVVPPSVNDSGNSGNGNSKGLKKGHHKSSSEPS